MLSFFNKQESNVQKEWYEKGLEYAQAVNDMVRFAEENGWEDWNGEDPEDKREHLAEDVLNFLRAANENGEVQIFRKNFPPAHEPLVECFKDKSQSIEQLHFIDTEKIIFLTGTAYQKRQAYILNEDRLTKLDEKIRAIGKSKQGNIFAIATENKVVTTNGWQGEIIGEFMLRRSGNLGITELIPFNDGKKILLISDKGIFLISENLEQMIHPINEDNEEDWSSQIDMENATLSFNNEFIVTGDQCSNHRILNKDGHFIGFVGPQSSYPHFCLFSKDDQQLLTNSCHFYNGVSIGVDTEKLQGSEIEPYEESNNYAVLDEEMRVYAGLAVSGYYILGDANGYIRAIDKEGNVLWRHHLGSTICGMTISDDEQTLWVSAYSGMIHKLRLGKGQSKHTIGTGNHAEEFRLILWKNEPKPLFW